MVNKSPRSNSHAGRLSMDNTVYYENISNRNKLIVHWTNELERHVDA